MATLTIHGNQNTTTSDEGEITAFLAALGVNFERWPVQGIAPGLMEKEVWDDADKNGLLTAYDAMREKLRGQGYVASDVVALHAGVPGLAGICAKYAREHHHTDDEVRFVAAGEGVFGFAPEGVAPFDLLVHAGDFINVPKGVWHWFNLTGQKRIVAIRFFQDPAGWVAHYHDGSHS